MLAAAVGAVVPGAWRDPARWAPALVATALVIGLALDLRSDGTGVPSWRRQVDEGWMAPLPGLPLRGFGFGVQLGFGLVTIVTSTTTYAVALTAAWSGDLGAGAVLGGTFGSSAPCPSPPPRRSPDTGAAVESPQARLIRPGRPPTHH